jgi:hypothetical protein
MFGAGVHAKALSTYMSRARVTITATEQRDPAHGGRAAETRGRKNAAHQAALREWKGERPDAAVFINEILPGSQGLPIGELVTATGLSEHYCSLIRLGKKTPHPRHWQVLQSLTSAS